MKIIELKTITNMKKLTILLAFALVLGGFTACSDEENKLPYIPYEPETPEVPAEGEDAQSQTINYKLGQVLLCEPNNPGGVNLLNKFDFFNTVSMTVIQSPTGIKVTLNPGDVPFVVWDVEIPEEGLDCELDKEVVPNELRIKGTKTVIATYEKDGFTATFQLDSDQLTYKYKFQSF